VSHEIHESLTEIHETSGKYIKLLLEIHETTEIHRNNSFTVYLPYVVTMEIDICIHDDDTQSDCGYVYGYVYKSDL
jgi:hypothetical protein